MGFNTSVLARAFVRDLARYSIPSDHDPNPPVGKSHEIGVRSGRGRAFKILINDVEFTVRDTDGVEYECGTGFHGHELAIAWVLKIRRTQ